MSVCGLREEEKNIKQGLRMRCSSVTRKQLARLRGRLELGPCSSVTSEPIRADRHTSERPDLTSKDWTRPVFLIACHAILSSRTSSLRSLSPLANSSSAITSHVQKSYNAVVIWRGFRRCAVQFRLFPLCSHLATMDRSLTAAHGELYVLLRV